MRQAGLKHRDREGPGSHKTDTQVISKNQGLNVSSLFILCAYSLYDFLLIKMKVRSFPQKILTLI